MGVIGYIHMGVLIQYVGDVDLGFALLIAVSNVFWLVRS